MSVVRERVGGGYHVNQPLSCHLVTATQQTRDIDTMLANGGPPLTTLGQHWPTSRMALTRYMFIQC